MSSQDIIRTGRKAKNETEAFINRYLNDQAKGWPRICGASRPLVDFADSAYGGYSQGRQAETGLRAHPRSAG